MDAIIEHALKQVDVNDPLFPGFRCVCSKVKGCINHITRDCITAPWYAQNPTAGIIPASFSVVGENPVTIAVPAVCFLDELDYEKFGEMVHNLFMAINAKLGNLILRETLSKSKQSRESASFADFVGIRVSGEYQFIGDSEIDRVLDTIVSGYSDMNMGNHVFAAKAGHVSKKNLGTIKDGVMLWASRHHSEFSRVRVIAEPSDNKEQEFFELYALTVQMIRKRESFRENSAVLFDSAVGSDSQPENVDE